MVTIVKVIMKIMSLVYNFSFHYNFFVPVVVVKLTQLAGYSSEARICSVCLQ